MSKLIYGGKAEPKCKKSMYHTLETHDWHIKRYNTCLYCNSGSRAVHKSLLNSDGSWKEKEIKELVKDD